MTRKQLLDACVGNMIFSVPMVEALLEERKNRTMRAMRCPEDRDAPCWSNRFPFEQECEKCGREFPCVSVARHHVGDIIYVWERHRFIDFDHIDGRWSASVQFADMTCGARLFWTDDDEIPHLGWRPSIHMPKAATRIFMRVSQVKSQRPQFLTPEEIIAEGTLCTAGVRKMPCAPDSCGFKGADNCGYLLGEWARLWDAVRPKKRLELYGYEANPLCWVYGLEVLKEEVFGHDG